MSVTAETGVCRNPGCSIAVSGDALDRYEGAGEYCPECGERLLPAPRARAPATQTLPAARGSPWPRRLLLVALGALLVAGVAFAVLRGAAAGRGTVGAVTVCGSSITQRLAADLVQRFAATATAAAGRVRIGGGTCDVRFAVAATSARSSIGHDAIVVVVNPANPLAALSVDQVRGILGGRITNWAQTGAPTGTIVPVLPPDDSDEVRMLRTDLLRDTAFAANARRLASSTDVSRDVASAGGRNRIGIVAFSAAVPAKVLALRAAPPPSVLSIADHRYPLSLDVTVDGPGRHDPLAEALARFARSEDAQSIVVRDGIIALKGY